MTTTPLLEPLPLELLLEIPLLLEPTPLLEPVPLELLPEIPLLLEPGFGDPELLLLLPPMKPLLLFDPVIGLVKLCSGGRPGRRRRRCRHTPRP